MPGFIGKTAIASLVSLVALAPAAMAAPTKANVSWTTYGYSSTSTSATPSITTEPWQGLRQGPSQRDNAPVVPVAPIAPIIARQQRETAPIAPVPMGPIARRQQRETAPIPVAPMGPFARQNVAAIHLRGDLPPPGEYPTPKEPSPSGGEQVHHIPEDLWPDLEELDDDAAMQVYVQKWEADLKNSVFQGFSDWSYFSSGGIDVVPFYVGTDPAEQAVSRKALDAFIRAMTVADYPDMAGSFDQYVKTISAIAKAHPPGQAGGVPEAPGNQLPPTLPGMPGVPPLPGQPQLPPPPTQNLPPVPTPAPTGYLTLRGRLAVGWSQQDTLQHAEDTWP